MGVVKVIYWTHMLICKHKYKTRQHYVSKHTKEGETVRLIQVTTLLQKKKMTNTIVVQVNKEK